MWTGDLRQPNCNNGESAIEYFVWAISPITCIARWGMFWVKISVVFHDIKQFRRDMWSISSQDGCCTLTGCVFLALPSQERRYGSPPWGRQAARWMKSASILHGSFYLDIADLNVSLDTGCTPSVWYILDNLSATKASGSELAAIIAQGEPPVA